MINTTVIKATKQEILEVDIMCFLCEMLESGTELAIIVYPEQGQPKRIDLEKGFEFTVENNKLELYNKTEEAAIFVLDRLTDYDFWDYADSIKLEHIWDELSIKMTPTDEICEEEDALCMRLEMISL